jgi:hypothetical protein
MLPKDFHLLVCKHAVSPSRTADDARINELTPETKMALL